VYVRAAPEDQLRPKVPKLAAFMDEAEAEVLAFMSFRKDHRRKIHDRRAWLTAGVLACRRYRFVAGI
jgi:transposase-like protein